MKNHYHSSDLPLQLLKMQLYKTILAIQCISLQASILIIRGISKEVISKVAVDHVTAFPHAPISFLASENQYCVTSKQFHSNSGLYVTTSFSGRAVNQQTLGHHDAPIQHSQPGDDRVKNVGKSRRVILASDDQFIICCFGLKGK